MTRKFKTKETGAPGFSKNKLGEKQICLSKKDPLSRNFSQIFDSKLFPLDI